MLSRYMRYLISQFSWYCVGRAKCCVMNGYPPKLLPIYIISNLVTIFYHTKQIIYDRLSFWQFEPTVPSVDCYFGTTLGPQEIVWLPGRLIQLTLLALCVQICTIQVKTFWKSLKKYITYENDVLPVGILCHFVFLKTHLENN